MVTLNKIHTLSHCLVLFTSILQQTLSTLMPSSARLAAMQAFALIGGRPALGSGTLPKAPPVVFIQPLIEIRSITQTKNGASSDPSLMAPVEPSVFPFAIPELLQKQWTFK